MDFYADKVSELNCGRCGESIDPKGLPPLRPTPCPNCGAEVIVPAKFGTFLLTKGLGFGATGYVCQAFDDQLHRQVAVKILKAGEENKVVAAECTKEARALAALNHPNIVQIYSIGEYRSQSYIVMELLRGGSGEQFINKDKALGETRVLDIGIQLAEGLSAAHGVGLVHMDVKPDNILFDDKQNAKLIDFGAAVGKMKDSDSDEFHGTPYYVAPEIVRGKTPDYRADIYSLGATLFHLLVHAPPFGGETTKEVLAKRLKRPAPDLRQVNDEIHPETADVIGRMLLADPDERYGNYDELVQELKAARLAADQPIVEEEDPFAALVQADTRAKTDVMSPKRGSKNAGKTGAVGSKSGGTVIGGGVNKGKSRTRRVDQPEEKEKLPLGLILGIVGLAVFALTVGAVVVMNSGEDKKGDQDKTEYDTARPSYTQVDPIVKTDDVSQVDGPGNALSQDVNSGDSTTPPSSVKKDKPDSQQAEPDKPEMKKPKADDTQKADPKKPAPKKPEPKDTKPKKTDPDKDDTKKPEPKKDEPKPVKGIQRFEAVYKQGVPYLDKKMWYTLDVLSAESQGGAKFDKDEKDGDLEVSGKLVKDDVYTIVGWTDLDEVKGFRFGVYDDSELPKKGPGRAEDGTFFVREMTIEAAPLSDPDAFVTYKVSAAAENNRDGDMVGMKLFDDEPDYGWAISAKDTGKGSRVKIALSEAIENKGGSIIRITLQHKDLKALGKFDIAATSDNDPTKLSSGKRTFKRESAFESGFHAVEIVGIESEKGLEYAAQEDGSWLVDSPKSPTDVLRVKVRIPVGNVTGLRLVALPDKVLPNNGPGRGGNGVFALAELELKAAAMKSPDQYEPVEIEKVEADAEETPFLAERVIDGKPNTYWSVRKQPGEERLLTIVPKKPIGDKDGSVVTLVLNQRLGFGRIKVLATQSKDAKVLATPKPEEKVADSDGEDKDDKPSVPMENGKVKLYVNVGGGRIEYKKDKWVNDRRYAKSKFGYVSGKSEKREKAIPNAPPMLATGIEGIKAYRVTIPNGRYKVTLWFGEVDAEKDRSGRNFSVMVEGRNNQTVRFKVADRPKVLPAVVTDGILDIEFQGNGTILNGLMVEGL